MREGYLIKDREEVCKFRLVKGRWVLKAWFVNAYRIVNSKGRDLTSWVKTKKEARELAKVCNIKLIEDENI